MLSEKRGLRLPFSATAEVILEGSRESIPGRVTELSFRGCFLEISSPLKEKQRLRIKVVCANKFFEALAEVIYARPTGVGLVFSTINPTFRKVLQDWILAALDEEAKLAHP